MAPTQVSKLFLTTPEAVWMARWSLASTETETYQPVNGLLCSYVFGIHVTDFDEPSFVSYRHVNIFVNFGDLSSRTIIGTNSPSVQSVFPSGSLFSAP